MTTTQHDIRIYKELRDVGIGRWAVRTLEGRHAPTVIHEDEHIGAAVSGFCDSGYVMLIATDRRIVFLDKKPVFTNIDEVTYDVVSGVECNDLMLFAGVTLHTRVKDYVVKWVNEKAAHNFVSYIESRQLEHAEDEQRVLAVNYD